MPSLRVQLQGATNFLFSWLLFKRSNQILKLWISKNVTYFNQIFTSKNTGNMFEKDSTKTTASLLYRAGICRLSECNYKVQQTSYSAGSRLNSQWRPSTLFLTQLWVIISCNSKKHIPVTCPRKILERRTRHCSTAQANAVSHECNKLPIQLAPV